MMLTIVLADDHKVVRKGLKALLCSEPDFDVIGEAEDGRQALELVENLQPDILVLDLMMPEINGLEVTRRLCSRERHTRVVILSMHNNEAYILEALRVGASSYILKESPPEELLKGIRLAVAGKRYLGHPICADTIESYSNYLNSCTGELDRLTDREKEILKLAAHGLSNQEIAAELGISPRTVATHRANLMHKLNLRSQSQMLQFAVRQGLIAAGEG
jgi:DNA-binding NarL/FixJ family response regulator